MPEIVQRGRRIVFREEGMDRPGAPVLMAHCSLAHSGLWKPILAELSKERPVIAPDLPAHGRSDTPPEGESLQIFSAEVCEALAERFGRPAHLVGLSLGGAALSRVARRRPDLTASLTMIEPVLFHLLDAPGEEPEVPPVTESDAELAEELKAFVGTWGAPGGFERMEPETRARLLGAFRLLREDQPWVIARPEGQIELVDFRAMGAPLHLVSGATSPEKAPEVLDRIKAVRPDARRVVIEGAGHLSPVTHPMEVLAELRAFFEAVEMAPAR